MPKSVPAAIPKLSVAATKPNKNGIAPGTAPTVIAKGEIRLRGVYTKTYKAMESKPKAPDFDIKPKKLPCGLIWFKAKIPKAPISIEKINA